MQGNPIKWFEIYVEDMERAKKFYEGVFQTKLEKLNSPGMELYSFPMKNEMYGAGGALVKMEGYKPSGSGTLVYFSSNDCTTEEKRVSEFGGKIERAKTSIGEYGFISLVYDTEGNMIGLHSME